MNSAQIAKTILEVRKRPSPFILNGEMQRLLGPDGFQEALNRRWLIHHPETGSMTVTHMEAFIAEMRKLAEDVANGQDVDPEVGDSVVVAIDGQSYQATVKSRVGQDGYELSFPPGKAPVRPTGPVKKTELKRFAKPQQPVPQGSVPTQNNRPGTTGPAQGTVWTR